MRKNVLFIVMLVALASLVPRLDAGNRDHLGLAHVQQITLNSPTRVGNALLQPGSYEVRHLMDGAEHIMAFTPIGSFTRTQSSTVKVPCRIVPMPERSRQTLQFKSVNSVGEVVLEEVIFKGERLKHIFSE